MSTVTVSSKGQIVLPAALRRRLRMGAGSIVEVTQDGDSLRLRVVRPVESTDLKSLAGLVKAPARGVPGGLEDFDPAALTARARPARP